MSTDTKTTPRRRKSPNAKKSGALRTRTRRKKLLDPAKVDPRAVLATIAADEGASVHARVAAAKLLLANPPDDEELSFYGR